MPMGDHIDPDIHLFLKGRAAFLPDLGSTTGLGDTGCWIPCPSRGDVGAV